MGLLSKKTNTKTVHDDPEDDLMFKLRDFWTKNKVIIIIAVIAIIILLGVF